MGPHFIARVIKAPQYWGTCKCKYWGPRQCERGGRALIQLECAFIISLFRCAVINFAPRSPKLLIPKSRSTPKNLGLGLELGFWEMASPENSNWGFDYPLMDNIPVPDGDFGVPGNGFFWTAQGINCDPSVRYVVFRCKSYFFFFVLDFGSRVSEILIY